MVLSALSRLFVLKSSSNNKYVCLTKVEGSASCPIKANGDHVSSHYCKLEQEKAENGERWIHIRSCYNNKYWMMEGPNSESIVAGAAKPNENRSEWSCTLFEPVYPDGDATTIQIRCVRSGKFVAPLTDGTASLSLCAAGDDGATKFAVTDWQSLVILPKRVAFKGDNGKYLGVHFHKFLDASYSDLEFKYSEIGDPAVAHEITMYPDGRTLRIKSLHKNTHNKFWACSRYEEKDWVHPNSPSHYTTYDLFEAIKVDFETIALRNLGNKMICKRDSVDGMKNGLHASSPSLVSSSYLKVEELVIRREIFKVEFRDSRTYEEVISTEPLGAENATVNNDTMVFKYKHTNITSTTWNRGFSIKVGVNTTIKLTKVPVINGGELQFSTQVETQSTVNWGETKTETEEKEVSFNVNVTPNNLGTVIFEKKTFRCEIPFSCTARDLRTDGVEETYKMDDGLYTLVGSAYKFHHI